ncbi:MAG: ferredoxin--nitrite reductase [Chloroflexota bacterium]|nr:ferredoxin--nitrite reductase [Chloroflexota bacterium]
MNKIEAYKAEKNGLDVRVDLPRYAAEGWETISDGDRERLKWLGVFLRRQTPGHFMMRLRVPNGISNAAQFRAIAGISSDFGKDFADLTTRQQIQLRWFRIDQVQEIWDRLEAVGIVSLQTGMDNVRGIMGCPVAGLTPNELFDASEVVREYSSIFVGNREYTNLPRKFNVTITGCLDNCTHAVTQDIALTPALRTIDGQEFRGFNVAVGGKQGSGGFRPATDLDIFVLPRDAAVLCSKITLLYCDYGPREARNKSRLAFLVEEWGAARFRSELEARAGHPLLTAGRSAAKEGKSDHIGIHPQKEAGLNYVGLVVPVGRITAAQMMEVARLADTYGNGEIRLTGEQNLIIPNVPDGVLPALKREPLLREFRPDPSPVMRGLVSCTGIDYCHFALVDTKGLALETSRELEKEVAGNLPALSINWSGCPNACGNHTVADIGLLGKKERIGGEVVEAVDVFLGGKAAAAAGIITDGESAVKTLENVPCNELPKALSKALESLRPAPAALSA